jgi:hypothetical protein
MKTLLVFLLLSYVPVVFGKFVADGCPPDKIRTWNPQYGYVCGNFPSVSTDCIMCQNNYQGHWPHHNLFTNFPSPIYQPQVMPWWAYQGNMYYPNLHYPGAWSNHGMNSHHYPGQGQVFAAKPNVYVETIHRDKKFSFTFKQKDVSFLATTPILDQDLSWKGRLADGDKFELAGINYDYLFYDVRLPKEKMQFDAGLCATREDTIKWMLKDLGEMSYPQISLQDFDQHWTVKIPDYPYFCIYPQYNHVLDEALPVEISLEQTQFIRTLYVLVPHKSQPSIHEEQKVPLPTQETESNRPKGHIRKEVNLREWGVAFLGE